MTSTSCCALASFNKVKIVKTYYVETFSLHNQ